MEIISKGIAEKLELSNFPGSKVFRVADLGCSVGPNTFLAVQNIVDSVEHKYKRQGLGHLLPEFQVFFNDHVSNDFNQLFTSLPPKRRYYSTGVLSMTACFLILLCTLCTLPTQLSGFPKFQKSWWTRPHLLGTKGGFTTRILLKKFENVMRPSFSRTCIGF